MLDFSEILIKFAGTYFQELNDFKETLLSSNRPLVAHESENGISRIDYDQIQASGSHRNDLRIWFTENEAQSAIIIYHGIHSASYGKSHIVRVTAANAIPTVATQNTEEANSIIVRIMDKELGEHMLVVPFQKSSGIIEYSNVQVIQLDKTTHKAA